MHAPTNGAPIRDERHAIPRQVHCACHAGAEHCCRIHPIAKVTRSARGSLAHSARFVAGASAHPNPMRAANGASAALDHRDFDCDLRCHPAVAGHRSRAMVAADRHGHHGRRGRPGHGDHHDHRDHHGVAAAGTGCCRRSTWIRSTRRDSHTPAGQTGRSSKSHHSHNRHSRARILRNTRSGPGNGIPRAAGRSSSHHAHRDSDSPSRNRRVRRWRAMEAAICEA